MKHKLYLVVTHGVGPQDEDFADKMLDTLRSECAGNGYELHVRTIHWAPLMQLNSKAFLEKAMLLGSRGNASTRLVVNALSDALAYRAERPVGKNIFALMDYQVSQLRGQPVHFLGHSLGALINADYLRTRPDIRIGSMQTFGTNIPLFTLGDKFDVPARLKVGKVPWYNWLYASDCMGYPLCTLSELEHVKDIILDEAAGWRWSYLIPGLSHVDYFSDKVFAQQLAQTMMKL